MNLAGQIRTFVEYFYPKNVVTCTYTSYTQRWHSVWICTGDPLFILGGMESYQVFQIMKDGGCFCFPDHQTYRMPLIPTYLNDTIIDCIQFLSFGTHDGTQVTSSIQILIFGGFISRIRVGFLKISYTEIRYGLISKKDKITEHPKKTGGQKNKIK